MPVIKLKRGLKANLPALAADGEPVITSDSHELYLGTGTGLVPQVVDWANLSSKPSFGGAATLSVGTTAGTVAAGDDSRIVNAVPNTRTVNGNPLSANVTLTATDVGALATAQRGATSGVCELDSNTLVPTTRLPAIDGGTF